jgi:Na+/H+-dicarboxylate symporter
MNSIWHKHEHRRERAGITIILAVDELMEMARTTVNPRSDAGWSGS